MDLSILIAAHNVKSMVKECLSRIKDSKDRLEKEVIFIDNGSTDGTADLVKGEFPETVLIRSDMNLGFGRANNFAYPKAKGRYILLLNVDAFVGEDTLQKTVEFMDAHVEYGILGCRLIGGDGKLQPSARYFPTPWKIFLSHLGIGNKFPNYKFLRGIDDMSWDHNMIRETDWVPGCFLLIRKDAVRTTGFLLRQDFFMYYDDCDLCLRVKRNGWKVIFYPEDVVHLGGEGSKKIAEITKDGKQILKYQFESEFIYFRKNYGLACVLEDLFFILLFDLIRIAKKTIRPMLKDTFTSILKHIRLAMGIAVETGLGGRPIH